MTGPMVLMGRETSMVWLGISGVWTGSGLVGIIPKLHDNNQVRTCDLLSDLLSDLQSDLLSDL